MSKHATRQGNRFLVGAVFTGTLAVLMLAATLAGIPLTVGSILLIIGLPLAGAFLVKWVLDSRQANSILASQAELERQKFEEVSAQLQNVMNLNREMLASSSESGLVESVLVHLKNLLQAAAISYVPMDEWGQPEAGFARGEMPDAILKAWAEHLATVAVRTQCKNCLERQSENPNCPLLTGPFADDFRIYCFPVHKGSRIVAMLNVFLPLERRLNPEQHNFVQAVVEEMTVASQSIRFEAQESSTQKQLQLARSSQQDFSRFLVENLHQLGDALQMECAVIHLTHQEGFNGPLEVTWGDQGWLPKGWIERVQSDQQETSEIAEPALLEGSQGQAIFLPLYGNADPRLGFVLFAGRKGVQLDDLRRVVLLSWGRNLTLVIEIQRELNILEYKSVMQERIRLAREIHDGLAQTLAFLKLQAAQMQNLLTRGEMERLAQILEQNYQALSAAYVETRQVIDNLRLGPQLGFLRSLEKCILDFESASGLPVERKLEKLPWEIPVEIHAQMVRIVQEVFSNIRKHAHASAVKVDLRAWNGDLLLDILDNGVGFDPEDIPEFTQYGLKGMQERAEMIGADFQITSRPNQGTVVHLRLPSSILEMFL